MRSSGVVWTEAKLRAFIKSTDDVVPGNKMRFFGIRDEKQITDLLAYLQTFK
ncbi:Cytochrome c2 precursor [compost metagenome]